MFWRDETEERKNVVLINEALARLYFPGENPIGRKITIDMRDENVPSLIIGIVGNAKQQELNSPAKPSVYWPHPELAYTFMSIVIRTANDPLEIAPAVVATIDQLDSNQPLADLRTMEDWLGDSTARAEFNMALLAVLSGIALILAAAGIYGVMSHAVAQRTREMGIRMAMGAGAAEVFRLVLKEGSVLLLIGSAIGCAATFGLTRLMQSMLYETSASNPFAFVIVLVILVLTGLIACWIPSRRAARVNPIEALRYE